MAALMWRAPYSAQVKEVCHGTRQTAQRGVWQVGEGQMRCGKPDRRGVLVWVEMMGCWWLGLRGAYRACCARGDCGTHSLCLYM